MSTLTQCGYLIPTREAVMNAPGGRADIRRMLELAELAERKGFDSLWVGDSILARPRFEALTTLAAIAVRTHRAQLGTAVYLTPLRHPVPLAHTVANLDLIAGGRFLFGIGTGTPTPAVQLEYANCGLRYEQRGRLQEEGLQVLKGLWTGQPVTFAGQLYQVREATLHPLPGREGGPPVLLAAAAERPLRRLARLADGWLPISRTPEKFSRHWEQLQGYCLQAGRDPNKLLRILYVTLNINRDATQARKETEAFFQSYYGAAHEQVSRAQAIAAGEPESCAEFLRGFVRAGVSHFVVRFAASDQQRQMDALLAQVVPLVSGKDS